VTRNVEQMDNRDARRVLLRMESRMYRGSFVTLVTSTSLSTSPLPLVKLCSISSFQVAEDSLRQCLGTYHMKTMKKCHSARQRSYHLRDV